MQNYFLSTGSLRKMSTGETEYNLGDDTFTPDISKLLVYSTEHLLKKKGNLFQSEKKQNMTKRQKKV